MSQTEETKVETVEVTNKYDSTQLKNAVDDEFARFYGKEKKFSQSHVHADIKLLLGYVSCFIAAGAFLYEYKTSFNEAFNTTVICVVIYWIIQAVAFAYSYLVEKDEIFSGAQSIDGKTTGSLKISGKLDKYSPKYQLNFVYNEKSSGKSVTYSVEPNIATWFTTTGKLSFDVMDKDLSSYLDVLVNKLHQN